MSKKKNLFIAFEGIDGSGKSTQVRLLSEYLTSIGHNVCTTAEPTDSPIGRMIRDIFNHRMEGDQRVIAALFAADRLHHLLHSQDGILKKLDDGYTVITDRYYFSSYAYHSVHNIDMEWVIQANSMSANLLRPDLNIYIDISPEVSMERLRKDRDTLEMYETLQNQQKVYEHYQMAFERIGDVEKVFFTAGNRNSKAIAMDIQEEINAILQDLK
ncbi:MAG: dTMP kinase [Saprospiraceae bacterium]